MLCLKIPLAGHLVVSGPAGAFIIRPGDAPRESNGRKAIRDPMGRAIGEIVRQPPREQDLPHDVRVAIDLPREWIVTRSNARDRGVNARRARC